MSSTGKNGEARASESPEDTRRGSIRVDPALAGEEDARVLAQMGSAQLLPQTIQQTDRTLQVQTRVEAQLQHD